MFARIIRFGWVLAAVMVAGALVGAVPALAVSAPTVRSVSPTSGRTSGATRVTIIGARFVHVTRVAFGSTRGTSIRVLSSTKLRVTTPAHTAGVVDVRVTTRYGTSARHAADHYTYVSPPRVSSLAPTTGRIAGGTRVTIFGARFLHVTQVRFGASAGTSISVVSSTKLLVTAPARAAGSVDVKVTTRYGVSATTSADRYTYIAPPVVTAISPTTGPTDGGTSVTVSGANFTAVSSVSFDGVAGTSLSVSSPTSLQVTSPTHGAGLVDIQVATQYGTSATSAADHFTYASVSGNVVVVTTTADDVNGDVSSVAALNANPGADGVSLREAQLATDATGGSATAYIMFSGALNGQTIEVSSGLPPISRDHVVLEGVAPDGSPARVTLDGQQTSSPMTDMLYVRASEVTVRWLRFTGVDSKRWPNVYVTAMTVCPGTYMGQPGPSSIANVQIVDNVFDNSAVSTSPTNGPQSKGLYVGTMFGANTRVSGITIARNTFTNYGDDAVAILEAASGSAADGVVISDNTFNQDLIPIEVGVAGTAPSITGTQIIRNTIIGGEAIWLTANAVNGTIDQTLIADNTISGLPGAAIGIAASGGIGCSGNVISNTQIINNTIHANAAQNGGIYMEASDHTSSSPCIISGVTIENDTFVDDQPGSLYVAIPNGNGASGNQITGVTVRNSIFYEPSGDSPIATGSSPVLSIPPDTITNSLISGPGWAGSNGNINSNPLFADELNGDYHLMTTSPAINAGTTIGAPLDDFDGAWRDAQPDIGAFEFGAEPRPLLTVTTEELAGSGTVSSSPAGIACGTACDARFDRNTTVTLTATPASGSVFGGWSGGGCSGTGPCTVTMSSDQTVTATFVPITHTP